MNLRPASLLLISCISVQSATAQSQLTFNSLNDFGDGTVQTFIAESNALISGVRLVVFGHGNAADVTVHIRDLLSDGSLDATILASGTLSSVGVPTDSADWRLIAFDAPFQFSLG